MKNFKNLKIWEKGMDIAENCFRLVETFPIEHLYGISKQITKSGISIPSNIAEGSSRRSEKDQYRFIEIALGSSFELETQLLLSQRIKFGNTELLQLILKLLDEEQKMIISFGAGLNK